METVTYETGAVRSSDRESQRFDLVSPVGLRRVAEACAEGAAKYSDHNWEKGMPVSVMLNHAIAHIYDYLAGDRAEDHLGHAAWNLLAACHSEELWPELNGDLRGEGCRPPTEAEISAVSIAQAETEVSTLDSGCEVDNPPAFAVGDVVWCSATYCNHKPGPRRIDEIDGEGDLWLTALDGGDATRSHRRICAGDHNCEPFDLDKWRAGLKAGDEVFVGPSDIPQDGYSFAWNRMAGDTVIHKDETSTKGELLFDVAFPSGELWWVMSDRVFPRGWK